MSQLNLFTQYDRTARQKLCLKTWLQQNMKGSIVASTGFGKTRVATNMMTLVHNRYPDYKFLVVVPTEVLKQQWESQLFDLGLSFNSEVVVINTVIKHSWNCDILVIDEIHRLGADQFSEVFEKVTYKYILGLTATFERLDGKHALIKKYCPVIDEITAEEALANGWVSPFTEYEVIINVPDIEIYNQYNKEFTEHFEFFNWDFDKAMSMVGPKGYVARIKMRDDIAPRNASKSELSDILKTITIHAMGFMRAIQARKAFINNHPKKIEIVNKIMNARPDAKIITFSNNIKMAESIEDGKYVYSGKDTKKKGRIKIEDFQNAKSGHLHTIAKANEGLDISGLSIAIILGLDSSKIKATQRRGRAIRFEPDKIAEIFNIVINNTVELEWFRKSHSGDKYVIIDENGLDKVLNYEEPEEYKKAVPKFGFRF